MKLALLVALLPGLAFAQSQQQTPPAPPPTSLNADAAEEQEFDCGEGTQLELNMCAQEDWDRADALLNEVYPLAIAAMKEMDSYQEAENQIGEKTLREAQRAWIAFRDKACEAEAFTFFGGSAAPMIYSSCMARLTDARTADLQIIADIGGL